jgi:hypothetical protein
MATYNEISQSLANSVRQGSNYGLKEQLKVSFRNRASKRIREDIERNGVQFGYSIRYKEALEVVDKIDDCEVVIDCKILRTVNKVTKPVRIKGDSYFLFIGDANGTSYSFERFSNWNDSEHYRYISKTIKYEYVNDRIYLKNNIKLKYVFIEGFYLSESVLNKCSATDGCYDDDTAIPIPDDMIESIKEEIRKTELLVLFDNKEIFSDDK